MCRKEAKESKYWLKLLHTMNNEFKKDINELQKEVDVLKRVISSIISNRNKQFLNPWNSEIEFRCF
ncbi:MAG: four helix bundle protein [Balneolaceae bacterium]|nr:MAG: four helix bundle protein [Balneolaceae bacterium]